MKSLCKLSRTSILVAWGALALVAHAQPQADSPAMSAEIEQSLQQRVQARDQERQEIATQRQQLQARKQEGEKACWQRFAVEDCLRNVRSQIREEDNKLRDREIAINNEERQDKAAERLRAIEQKKQEKQVPAPVTAMPRGEQPLQLDPVDAEKAAQTRDAEARVRAVDQAQRVQKHEAEVAEREATEAERRDKVKKNMQEKQQAAAERRARKADDIANRKGAPLPIPQNLPKP